MAKPDNTTYRLQRPGMALALLGCLFLFFLVIAAVLLPMVQSIVKRPEAAIRILALLQDILVFILPAVAMALVVTRLPARLLAVDVKPSLKPTLIALGVLVASIPAMNLIVEWNQSWHLPESMAEVETYFRQLEEGAQATTDLLLANSSVPALIVAVLIVGVMAGFSEELFFHGAFQRVLGMTRMNHHVVIWLVAIVFSAFHFQIFGFVPRMLLGAFFGYTLYWSGSLWIPIILHIFNNSVVVIATYCKSGANADGGVSIDTFGATLSSPLEIAAVIISLLMVIGGIPLLRRSLR